MIDKAKLKEFIKNYTPLDPVEKFCKKGQHLDECVNMSADLIWFRCKWCGRMESHEATPMTI